MIKELETVREVLPPRVIYLIPNHDEGIHDWVWCEYPDPELGMDAEDAAEYIRLDKQDEAELVEKVKDAMNNLWLEGATVTMEESAKAVLRAVGLLKEGE
jgi:hypothetical protein